MRSNTAKAKIVAGGTAVGAFCNINAPALVEALGLLGFDFVILDAEHGPFEADRGPGWAPAPRRQEYNGGVES